MLLFDLEANLNLKKCLFISNLRGFFFFDRQYLSLVLNLILFGLDYALVLVDVVLTTTLPAPLSEIFA